jgi:hypothetical protein
MKVNAALGVDRQRLEEQVHEKRLAATHATPDIQTSHTRLGPVTKVTQTLQPSTLLLVVIVNAALKILEQHNDLILGRISYMIVPAEVVFVRLTEVQGCIDPVSRSRRSPLRLHCRPIRR